MQRGSCRCVPAPGSLRNESALPKFRRELGSSQLASQHARAPRPQALSLPVAGVDGGLVAVVVLLGRQRLAEDARQLTRTLALCDGAAPFLEHVSRPKDTLAPRGSVSVGACAAPACARLGLCLLLPRLGLCLLLPRTRAPRNPVADARARLTVAVAWRRAVALLFRLAPSSRALACALQAARAARRLRAGA
jgi:hypothetical protein